jgi:hypothetical protein
MFPGPTPFGTNGYFGRRKLPSAPDDPGMIVLRANEQEEFPVGRHDDQCDSISQALLDKNTSFMSWLTPADWEVILAKARHRKARAMVNARPTLKLQWRR